MLKGNSLEIVWLQILDHVWNNGKEVLGTEEEMLEAQNLAFSYENPCLTDVKKYKKHVPGNYIENLAKIYKKNGSGWEGKNYAEYIYNAHGIDQIEKVITLLKKDPISKSAMVFLSDGSTNKSPCVVLLNFSIRNKQLDMNVIFKSSDIVKKFIPDMLALGYIHKLISTKLHVGRGIVSGQIFSAQFYDNDKTLLKNALDDSATNEDYDNQGVIKNWDIAAVGWEKAIKDSAHYVNFENGYERFIKHLSEILETKNFDNTIKAIDVGSGTGFISKLVTEKIESCDTLDISPKMLEFDKNISGEILLSSTFDIPVEDKYYDFAVSRGVLISHVGPGKAEKMLGEIHRVLKPNSLFYLDYITKFEDSEVRHKKTKNAFSSQEMNKLVAKCGFKVEQHFDNDNFRVTSILIRKI